MKFRVKALSVGGRNKQIFNSGEVVEREEFVTDRFEEDRPEKLVSEGFIEPIGKEKAKLEQDKEKKKPGPKPGAKKKSMLAGALQE